MDKKSILYAVGGIGIVTGTLIILSQVPSIIWLAKQKPGRPVEEEKDESE